MASIRKEIEITALPDDVWAAVRDIGALHTRSTLSGSEICQSDQSS
jgi:hypothetical protein